MPQNQASIANQYIFLEENSYNDADVVNGDIAKIKKQAEIVSGGWKELFGLMVREHLTNHCPHNRTPSTGERGNVNNH